MTVSVSGPGVAFRRVRGVIRQRLYRVDFPTPGQFQVHDQISFSQAAQRLISDFSQERPIRANTLLLTLFGDTICPHGGTIWLGSLIRLVAPLGISERLVRTSAYRLTEKQVLVSCSRGRRSFYTLTERGLRQFQVASKRIYASSLPAWDGGWCLVLSNAGTLDGQQREALRKELGWMGFSRISSGFYAHPTADTQALSTMLEDHGFSDQVVALQASAADSGLAGASNRLITQYFDLQETNSMYQGFVDTFQPVLQALRRTNLPNLQLCFLVRTLLIHKYRFILLHRPELPRALLPDDSIILLARNLTAELYLRLSTQADGYFLRSAESDEGGFQQPEAGYYQRFGGLD